MSILISSHGLVPIKHGTSNPDSEDYQRFQKRIAPWPGNMVSLNTCEPISTKNGSNLRSIILAAE
jgi:hypothetical protein